MFELLSGSNRSCDGVSRRNFLRVGALSAFGLGLPDLLRARAKADGPGKEDVSCILLWLQGGISHIDSFDPKPEAPAEIRGDFASIDTRVPGDPRSADSPLAEARPRAGISIRSSARSTPATGRTGSPTPT